MKRLMLVLLIFKDVAVCAKKYNQPNILMIYADDLGWNDVDWHDPSLQTPNLRKLAFSRHTVQLDQAYVNQLCSPTRSALMTGHYPYHIGTQTGVFWVMEPSGVPLRTAILSAASSFRRLYFRFPFFPEKLRDLGYNTYLVGKWHLGYCKYEFLPTRRGFEKFRGYYADKEGYYNHSRDLWKGGLVARGLDFFTETWNTSSVPDWSKQGIYSAEIFADESIRLLEDQDKKHPFFLYLAFQSVHAPLEVPEKYFRQCASIERWERRVYCGMLIALDEAIGRVVDALKGLDLYENTIIIFSSDNGGETMFGGNNFPLRGNKDTLWEGGARTNSFVHSQRFIKQQAVREQYGDCFRRMKNKFADCFTSSIGFRQFWQWLVKISSNMWPMILNGKGRRKSFVYNIDAKGAAIRDGHYKLIIGNPGNPSDWIPPYMDGRGWSPIGRGTWLFDLKNDPYERRDLSRWKVRVVRRLSKKLSELAKKSVPSVHMKLDDRGNPYNFGGVYASGWC